MLGIIIMALARYLATLRALGENHESGDNLHLELKG